MLATCAWMIQKQIITAIAHRTAERTLATRRSPKSSRETCPVESLTVTIATNAKTMYWTAITPNSTPSGVSSAISTSGSTAATTRPSRAANIEIRISAASSATNGAQAGTTRVLVVSSVGGGGCCSSAQVGGSQRGGSSAVIGAR